MKKLTKAEEQIMHALWNINKGFAKDIISEIEGKQPAYNTVLTVLRVLVDKGFVKYETFGKANRYEPVYTREEYSKFVLSTLKQNYFQNSSQKLLSFLIKEENLKLDDIDEILKDLNKKK